MNHRATRSYPLGILLILVMFATALFAGPETAEAQGCSAPARYAPNAQYELTRNRNLRTGPGFGCTATTTVNSGATLTIWQPEVNLSGFIWAPVSVSGTSGWMAVRRSDGTGSVVTPISSPPPPGNGGCSGATPDQRFNPALERRISHPEFEARGWKVALRSGPSRDCGSSLIWANDNLAVEELGRYSGSDESWSLVRFSQGGTTGQRWAETRFLENRGGGTPSNARSQLVNEARKELDRYGGQHECNSAGLRSRIGRYWSAVGSGNNGCTNLEWSGVFVSWVVRQAGVSGFAHDQRHWWYIHKSFRGEGPYRVIDTRGGTAQAGDLVCVNRRSSSWTYDTWRSWSDRLPANPDKSRDGVEAHCDVVESLSGGRVTGIGGNLGNTVRRENHLLTRYDIVLRLQD